MVGESDYVDVSSLIWDDENVSHIAKHGVAPEHVEYILGNDPLFFENLSGRSATHVIIGTDQLGRVLYVPILRAEWSGVWRVISAWESRFARRLVKEDGNEEEL